MGELYAGHAEPGDEDRSAPYSGTSCRLGSPLLTRIPLLWTRRIGCYLFVPSCTQGQRWSTGP